jgi:23S rRNA (uracil1939-C5)-methyltransferase
VLNAKLPIFSKLLSLLTSNSEIIISIDSLAYGGSGVGRHKINEKEFVVFVPQTAPGDKVKVKITNLKKNYAEAEILEIFTSSPKRVTPPCPVFGKCGGCQWQHIDYLEQLRQKQSIVEHALKRIAKEDNVEILPIIASPQEWYYRNRVQFRTEGPHAGFYKKQSHQIIDIRECLIAEKNINFELANIINEIKPNDLHQKLKIEVLVDENGLAHRSINQMHGDELGFSQVNTLQNSNMKNYLCELIGKPKNSSESSTGCSGHLLDLYCGNGNFSLPLSHNGWQVYGVDLNKPAIKAAQKKAPATALFKAGDCTVETKMLINKNCKFEVAIIDPPRAGADALLWPSLSRLSVEKLIYVSCNPVTFARDWARIKSETNLKLISVQPFDMFPQTYHVELVALATR